jgi:hypothetical protein
MIKYLAIGAVCAVIILFLCLIGMLVLYTHSAPAENAAQKHEWYYSFAERPTDWLLALFSGLLVIATAALFISSERAVNVAGRSAEAASTSATHGTKGSYSRQSALD